MKEEVQVQRLVLRRDGSGEYVTCLCGKRLSIKTDRNRCETDATVVDRDGWIIELVEDGEPERKTAKTYTIYLCKNGKVFHSMPNVVNDPQPTTPGVVIEGKWKVVGVLPSTSATKLFVDVVEV